MPPPRRHFRRPSAPKPPPDEFCPQVPLPWKRELRKVQGRLPRLNKMRITLADERWSSPNRQWLTKKGRRRLEPIVSDDTGLGEAQEILAKDLMRELMADEVESQGSRAQTYRGTPDDEDVRSVLAHELCVRVVEPSSAEPERPGTERPEAQASEVHSHSDRPASSDVHSLVRRLFDSPEPPTEVASAAAADARDAEPPGADAAAAGAAWGAAVPGRMSPEVERLSEADASAGLARDVIRAAVPFRPAPCSTPPRSASELMVSEVSSHSHAARSMARNAIECHFAESTASPIHSDGQVPSIIEGDEAMQDVARDIVTNASMGNLRASPVSQLESGKTDSAAQSIARRAIQPHLGDSSAASHTRHSMDEIPSIIEGDEAMQDVARDIVTNASMGHLRASPVSQLESGKTDSAAQSIARRAIEPHLADSSAASHTRHSMDEIPSVIAGDEAVQDVARDIVTNASMGHLRASPVSQLESENTDSAARSIARRAIEPHLADSSAASNSKHSMDEIPSSQVEARSDMHQLKEEAGSDGYPAAQGVAREVIASATSRGTAEPHPATVQEQMHSEAEGYATAQGVARDCVASARQAPSPASPHSQVQSETVDSVAAQFVARQAVEPYRDGTGHPHPRHEVEVVEGSSGGATHDAIAHDTDSVVAQSITRQLVAMRQVEARSDMDHLKEEAGSDGYPAAQGVAREVIASATSRGIAEPHPATVQEQMHSEAEGYATAQVVARDCVTSAIQAPSPASPHSQVQSETVDSVAAQFVARQAVEPYRDSTGHPHPRHGVEVVEGSSGGASHDAVSHGTDSVVAQSITRQLVAMSQVEARSDMDHLKEEAGSDGYPAAQGVAREVIASATSRGIAEPHPATVQEQMHSEAEGYATAQVVARDCVTSAIQAPSPASPHSQVQSEAVDSPSAGIIAGEAVKQA